MNIPKNMKIIVGVVGVAVLAGAYLVFDQGLLSRNQFEEQNEIVQNEGQEQPQEEEESEPAELEITDLVVGSGVEVQEGNQVIFDYTMTSMDGRVIDTSEGKQPTAVVLGVTDIIPGLEQGLLGMKEGGKRRIVIPSQLAHGEKGVNDGTIVIEPNSTIILEVEVVQVDVLENQSS